ncbi:hypothetical protein WJX73_007819 [Symbiochloris irregularis]|uniref:Mitochondrial carrier protein n=1 Tax=Symbiochloris irregularis TaxID=706552 RepID=A0AAW1PQM4_9CHLO
MAAPPGVTVVKPSPRLSPAAIDFLAGAGSGAAGVLAGLPLDVVRVRQQIDLKSSRHMITQALSMVRLEGPATLLRGASYPLATITLQNAVVFQTYGMAGRWLSRDPSHRGPLTYSQVFLAGMVAGTVQTAIITPVDLLKIRMQLQTASQGTPGYVGSLRMLGRVVQKEGLLGAYRGFGVCLVRDVPSHGVYFGVYEYLRERLEPGSRLKGNKNPTAMFLAGGAAGVLSWLSVYPFDVIKARLQATSKADSPYTGWVHCGADSWRKEGFRSLWRGLSSTLHRAFICNAALFYTYEWLTQALSGEPD